MLELNAYFDDQLKQLHSRETVQKKRSEAPFRNRLLRCAGRGLLYVALLILPFLMLVKTSTYVYHVYNFSGWWALLPGMAAMVVVLILYGFFLSFKISGSLRFGKFIAKAAAGLVIVFCCYGGLYISSMNVKSAPEREHYRTLHPILRVTLATTILADSDLLITDMHRTPVEYHRMGLSFRQQSLHYRQSTGYVHAVDLRTLGRSEWKNILTEHLLKFLGFNTLRHTGTADHLHVALPLND